MNVIIKKSKLNGEVIKVIPISIAENCERASFTDYFAKIIFGILI